MIDSERLSSVRGALACIPPEEYDVWVRVGMALKNEWKDEGLDLWLEWSAGSDKFDEARSRRKWEYFGEREEGRSRVTLGSIFFIARNFGWDGGIARSVDVFRESAATSASDPEESAKIDRARKIWDGREAGIGNPMQVYLQNRGVWPSGGFQALSKSLGWVRTPEYEKYGCMGLMVAAYTPLRGNSGISAVEMTALREDGTRLMWNLGGRTVKTKTLGRVSGSGFNASGFRARADVVVVCEGPITGLALSLMYPEEAVVGFGGAGVMGGMGWFLGMEGLPVLIAADGDVAGRDACLKLAMDLTEWGKPFDVRLSPQGKDAADEWLERQGV